VLCRAVVGGRANRGAARGGTQSNRGNARGGRANANNNFNNHLVSYPIRTNAGFGALRQEKIQQRYNPIGFGMPSNGYAAF